MPKKIVVGYDDSEASKRAMDFAIERARIMDVPIVVAHVLEWSPYSFLTPNELAERRKRRREEMSRAEAALLEPLRRAHANSGVQIQTEIRYGHGAEALIKIANEVDAGHIVIGRTGKKGVSARVFGSVAGNLAQTAPIPVTIVP